MYFALPSPFWLNLHKYFEIWTEKIPRELAASKEMLGSSYQSDVVLLELQNISGNPRNITPSDHVYFCIPRAWKKKRDIKEKLQHSNWAPLIR